MYNFIYIRGFKIEFWFYLKNFYLTNVKNSTCSTIFIEHFSNFSQCWEKRTSSWEDEGRSWRIVKKVWRRETRWWHHPNLCPPFPSPRPLSPPHFPIFFPGSIIFCCVHTPSSHFFPDHLLLFLLSKHLN